MTKKQKSPEPIINTDEIIIPEKETLLLNTMIDIITSHIINDGKVNPHQK